MHAEPQYDGPAEWVELAPAGRPIRLLKPSDPDRLLAAPEVLEASARQAYAPYWAYLWPASHVLAEVVARRRWPEGVWALEIGCGLGLAGLAGLAAGLLVDFTDQVDAPLSFVEQSARAAGFDPHRWSTSQLDWRSPRNQTYPVILGADVLYERELVPLVVNLIARMLAPGGEALIAGPYRVSTEIFEPMLTDRGLVWTTESVAAVDQTGRTHLGTVRRISHSPPC
jgi:predicted nicotinamide N-methyase